MHTGGISASVSVYNNDNNNNIIINLLIQTIVYMDIKKYKTHIINKLKIIRTNGNQ